MFLSHVCPLKHNIYYIVTLNRHKDSITVILPSSFRLFKVGGCKSTDWVSVHIQAALSHSGNSDIITTFTTYIPVEYLAD